MRLDLVKTSKTLWLHTLGCAWVTSIQSAFSLNIDNCDTYPDVMQAGSMHVRNTVDFLKSDIEGADA